MSPPTGYRPPDDPPTRVSPSVDLAAMGAQIEALAERSGRAILAKSALEYQPADKVAGVVAMVAPPARSYSGSQIR